MSPVADKRPSRSAAVLAGAGLLWALALAFLVWPALRDSRQNSGEIGALESRIETLGGWSGGRALLTADAGQWEREQGARFERLFPRERRLQELFLQVATAANSSGVDPVQLRVLPPEGEGGQGRLLVAGGDPAEFGNLLDALDLSAADLPGCDLRAHRLRLTFDADYRDLARFGDALRRLDRAVTVRALRARRGSRGVNVDMELEYYVQARN